MGELDSVLKVVWQKTGHTYSEIGTICADEKERDLVAQELEDAGLSRLFHRIKTDAVLVQWPAHVEKMQMLGVEISPGRLEVDRRYR